MFICQGQPINFDHGATDPEGDSLVYSFYRPLSDINYLAANDLPFTAGNPNFALVNYNGGFGFNNPLGGANLTISSAGVIDGIPANIGQYVVGVRCNEYRDGILIGSIYRDFQFNVVICPPPALAGIAPVNGCAGTTIQFSNASSSNANGFTWDFGDGGTDTTQNPNHIYAGSGTYPVTLTVTSAFGCSNSITQNTTILPCPNADFAMSNTSVNQFEVVNFTDQSQPNVIAWQWDFGDSSAFDFNQNPSHSWDAAGTFPVTLVVTDNNGCIDTAIRYVVIFLPPKVPSAFSPNGDGQNDVLYVMGGPFKEIRFRIYNNWGEIIYESTEPSTCLNSNDHLRTSFGWDGTYNSVPQPVGVYVYTVFAITEDDVEHELSGDVTLLR